MKTSLEVEYWVVDEDGDLVAPDTLLDVSDQVDPEFVEPMLELKTTPCATTAELRTEFRALLADVVDAAREVDKRLVPLATPLHAAPADLPFREKRGTDLQRRIVGPPFDDARFCAGTHLHFEQSNVPDQLNALTAIDPAFALVTSSSHYRGEPIHACARPYLYRRSCYGACPEQGQLWSYVDSVDEWEARLESAYEGFRERALERGVDSDVFDDEFAPYDAVWTPVRLREAMPTVEWRSPDTALPSQVLQLAEEVYSVVERADTWGAVVEPSPLTADGGRRRVGRERDDTVRLPSFDAVEAATDAAIRDGLADTDVRRYLRRLGLTPSAYQPLARRHPDTRLTKRQARKYRLEAASRLELEVERHRVRA